MAISIQFVNITVSDVDESALADEDGLDFWIARALARRG